MSEVILGAIVGASSAILGSIIAGLLSEILKNSLQVKRQNRESLIKGCEDAKKILLIIQNDPSKLTDELIFNTKIILSIFASDALNICFDHLTGCILNGEKNNGEKNTLITQFNDLLRKELNLSRLKKKKKDKEAKK